MRLLILLVLTTIIGVSLASVDNVLVPGRDDDTINEVINLHRHWYLGAVGGLLSGMEAKLQKKLPPNYGHELKYCFEKAPKTDIQSKAKCLAKAFDLKHTEKVKWIGGFRVLRAKSQKSALRGRARLRWLNSFSRNRGKRQARVQFARRMPSLPYRKGPTIPKMLHQIFSPNTSTVDWKRKFNKLQRYGRLSRLAARQTFGRPKKEGISFLNQLASLFLSQKTESLRDKRAKFVEILSNQFSGSGFDAVRLLSPKLLSVIEPQGNNLLSPSLFSLDSNPEALLHLPSLLDGLNPQQKDHWLQLIMQVSGAQSSVDKILTYFEQPTSDTRKESLFKRTVQMMDKWEQLYQSYSTKQNEELKDQGYAFLDENQLQSFYGPESVFNVSDSQLDVDVGAYSNMSDAQKEEALENIVRSLAGQKEHPALKGWNRRLKQITLTPLVFNPVVLQPIVLGPITLSPNLFAPLILSPPVLSPITLSPGVGSPAILSPLVLSPATLTPTVLTPFIINPKVLSPLTVSPLVLSPAILSPLVLSPVTLSPGVLGGLYLSPFVLNPAILSPGVLNAVVLSPFALSPSVLSPSALSALVLSPSVLS